MGARFLIGSYTRMGGPGVALFETRGDGLRMLCTDPLPNATYIIRNAAGDRAYAICSDPAGETTGGSVAAYLIVEDGLVRFSRQDTLGAGPCHLCLSPDQRFLYAANYFSGSISVFPVAQDGGLGPCMQYIAHQGCGPDPQRQAGPHVHQMTFLPGEDRLCAVDLGLDALLSYDQDRETGLLRLHDTFLAAPGSGPRHLAYAWDGWAYLVHELGNTVSLLKREKGAWHTLQTLSTLPTGTVCPNTAAAVRIAPDGGRLLVSNRGHNSIAVYATGSGGVLTLSGIYPTGGDFPRDFDFVDGETLVICHQKGALTLARLHGAGLQTIAEADIKGTACVHIWR